MRSMARRASSFFLVALRSSGGTPGVPQTPIRRPTQRQVQWSLGQAPIRRSAPIRVLVGLWKKTVSSRKGTPARGRGSSSGTARSRSGDWSSMSRLRLGFLARTSLGPMTLASGKRAAFSGGGQVVPDVRNHDPSDGTKLSELLAKLAGGRAGRVEPQAPVFQAHDGASRSQPHAVELDRPLHGPDCIGDHLFQHGKFCPSDADV